MFAVLRFFGNLALYGFLIGSGAWAALALHYCMPSSFSIYAIALYILLSLAALFFIKTKLLSFLTHLVLFAVVLGWWLTLKPSLERDWGVETARLPSVSIDGDLVTVRNIRNFNYRSENDFDVHYYDRTFDVKKLKGIDMFISFWGSKMIAHTILSFVFEEGEPLAVSIETRKERGEEYSAVAGFFRQYELIYIAADERDIVRLRSNYRKEDVYLYHLMPPPEKRRAVFLDYIKRIDQLSTQPEFYNALLQNCTTSIYFSFQVAPPFPPLNWGIIFPGYLDYFIWTVATERGLTDIPFEDFRKQSYINPRAQTADQDPNFSQKIRGGLPQYN